MTDRLLRRFRPLPTRWSEAAQHRLVVRDAEPPPAACAKAAVEGGFRFLNVGRSFEGQDRWFPSGVPRLWVYQLHYFRWLWELPPARALELLLDWLAANPPLAGPGWEPYPLCMRIREWTEWLLAHPSVPDPQRAHLVTSLAHQVRALEAQLEYHLLGNHILENAVTLCWAGLSLEGPSAESWRKRGLRLLEEQLGAQVLADGTHDERSPMYQALLAAGLLRVARIAFALEAVHPAASLDARRIGELARLAGRRLASSLQELAHPDGNIALFNDSALGQAPTPADLAAHFPEVAPEVRVTDGLWALASAGYFGLRRPGFYLVLDAGAIGPDHQPGHGHADALSFELSHRGMRLLTDTGVLTYDEGPARAWDRGTAAHNTIEVDGLDQSEVWGAFRCGRRVGPVSGVAEWEGGVAVVRGAYTGPGAPRQPVRHARVCRIEGARLSFEDEVIVRGTHTAAVRLHVGEGLAVARRDGSVELTEGGARLLGVRGQGFDWQIEESPYHPEFGREVVRPCLVARLPFVDQLSLNWSVQLH